MSSAQKKQQQAHPLGRPSAAKQSSRKSKAAWRKNVQLDPSIENPSAALPPAPHTLTNEQLFSEDRRPDHTSANVALGVVPQRQRKQQGSLKSLDVLKNKSDTPAVLGRKKSSSAAAAAADRATRVSKEMKDQLRRIAHRPVHGALGGSVDAEQVGTTGLKSAAQTADFDMWSAGGLAAVAGQKGKGKKRKADEDEEEEEDEWIDDPRREQPKLPRTLAPSRASTSSDPLLLARSLPALPTPHPGTSYNPTAEDHAELVQLAYSAESRKEAEERRGAAFKTLFETNRRAAREGALAEEVSEPKTKREKGKSKKMSEQERVNQRLVKLMGMDSLPVDDAEAAEEEEGDEVKSGHDDEDDEGDKVYEIKRKTKAQRARAMRAKEEAAAAAARKQARITRAMLYTLPSLRKRALAAARERAEAAAAVRAKREARVRERGLEGVRVGRNKVGEVAVRTEVQLEEDLAEGLRGVKPEGNLFRDRFQSFQARALAEPGSNRYPVQKQGKTGRRGRKEYEIPSYRHFK
ncbi:hypothetical protein OC834_005627 [Tilletia horrida]|nr:hypothetical protein OC834_005627 [Tilletia horrida]